MNTPQPNKSFEELVAACVEIADQPQTRTGYAASFRDVLKAAYELGWVDGRSNASLSFADKVLLAERESLLITLRRDVEKMAHEVSDGWSDPFRFGEHKAYTKVLSLLKTPNQEPKQ